jgi:hypothetical protein
MRKDLSAYTNKYGEYAKFRAVCGTQNRIRIGGNNLCIHAEEVKIHKNEDISLNIGLT